MIAPSEVGAAARRLENENIKFRTFLKNHADYDELDRQFLELHNELFAEYDCCGCNNCCREFSVTLEDEEIGAIAAHIGLSEQAFTDKRLHQTPEGYIIKPPCCFLKENGECAIQTCKPAECREFPYTDKPGRGESLLSILSFAEVCPVVFEMLQRLKKLYGFKGKRL